jgi:hypothetical protein
VVSSSDSTFPRHWAWSHGVSALCDVGLDCEGEAVAAALPHAGYRRHGIGAKRVAYKLTRGIQTFGTASRVRGDGLLQSLARRRICQEAAKK